MSTHYFDSDIACDVGVNAAIIYQNIAHWCEKNRANNRNFHDGNWWTYNSVKAWQKLFPYLTDKQIRICLNNLEEKGYITKGNYNKEKRDRTSWFSANAFAPEGNCTFAPEGKALPNNKPDNKQDNARSAVPDDLVEKGFEIFWDTWKSAKKSIGVTDTSPRGSTFEKKWKPMFNSIYFKNHTSDQFKDEVRLICKFVRDCHAVEGFNRFANMQTGKFFTQKQWRDINDK